MSEGIQIALIGLLGSGLGSLIGVVASSKLTQYRIEQLEKRVEAHNNLIDRTYKLESHREVVDEEIDHLNHEVELLQQYHK